MNLVPAHNVDREKLAMCWSRGGSLGTYIKLFFCVTIYCFYFFFFKIFFGRRIHISYFGGHWYHSFGFMVMFPLGFKARVGSTLFIFVEANVMYIPRDLPLMLHLTTS